MTPISSDQYERVCFTCGACVGKPWVGLTDAELAEFSNMKLGAYDLCLEVEAKLKEKNGE